LPAPRGIAGRDAQSGPEARLTDADLITLDYIDPPPQLSWYVTTFYHFRCDERDIRDMQPAAIGHAMIFLRGEGEMFIENESIGCSAPFTVVAPLSQAAEARLSGPFHCVGAALNPLGWSAFTGMRADRARDRVYDAAHILGEEVRSFAQQCIAQYDGSDASGQAIAARLGEFLMPLTRRNPVNPSHVPLLARVATWLGESMNPSLDTLFATSGFSQRHTQRLIEQYFGMPPKQLVRLYRANRVAAILADPDTVADEIAACMDLFYDQPHMIRELRRYTGRTPARVGDGEMRIADALLDKRNFREIGGGGLLPEPPED
jgi:AraC-like DNA-binding protein